MENQKNLSEITSQELIDTPISTVYTWPYLPSGLLKEHEKYDTERETEQILNSHKQEFEDMYRFLELFSEKQKSALGWIFAAFVGVLGNLAINLGFASPLLSGNLWWMLLCLFIVAILTILYLKYLPTVSYVFRFIPSYVNFPEGYEEYIPEEQRANIYSTLVFQFKNLNEKVVKFGVLVKTALLRDHLLPTLKAASYIHISKIHEIDQHLPVFFITVSTKGIKPWLDPHGKEKIEKEWRDLINSLLYARMACSVRRFELNKDLWRTQGASFLDAISEWKLDDIRNEILKSLNRKNL